MGSAGGGPSVAVPRPVDAKTAHREGGGTAAQAPHPGSVCKISFCVYFVRSFVRLVGCCFACLFACLSACLFTCCLFCWLVECLLSLLTPWLACSVIIPLRAVGIVLARSLSCVQTKRFGAGAAVVISPWDNRVEVIACLDCRYRDAYRTRMWYSWSGAITRKTEASKSSLLANPLHC